jgi:hypothetical protein
MSFIITIATREGIVMAADSRLTLTFPDPNYSNPKDPNEKLRIAVPQSDTTRKLFLAHNRIGISTCGDAVIEGTPISGFIESFILSLPQGISVAETATGLLEYVRQINPNLNAWFHVTGYSGKNGVQVTEAWLVGIAENHTRPSIASGEQGAQWNGELDITSYT